MSHMPLVTVLRGRGAQRGQGARQVMILTCVCEYYMTSWFHHIPSLFLIYVYYRRIMEHQRSKPGDRGDQGYHLIQRVSPHQPRHKTKLSLLKGDLFCVRAVLCY